MGAKTAILPFPVVGRCRSRLGTLADVVDSFRFATGRHLPHGITQCYLPPDRSERAPLIPASKLVLDLPTPEGWKTELA